MALESYEARYLVHLYIECREHKILPCPGGPQDQTAFIQELFDFLDNIVNKKRFKDYKDAKAQAEKSSK